MVNFFAFLANILLPVTSFFLCYRHPEVTFGRIFSVGIFIHTLYRIWETFFTSKECTPQKFEGDWTLIVCTLTYIVFCFLITFEFFLIPHQRYFEIFIVGILLYLIAARFRFWGETTLGRQWAVHVIGNTKTNKSKLLQIGPYKFIRHPIYFGIILEELSLPLISATYFSLIFAVLVTIPLQLMRLTLEEKRSIQKFGDDYVQYKDKVGLFFPKSNRISFFRELLVQLRRN